MASKKSKGTGEQKINKQFILDHLDEKEIDLSMCNLSQVPVKELVSGVPCSQNYLCRVLYGLSNVCIIMDSGERGIGNW